MHMFQTYLLKSNSKETNMLWDKEQKNANLEVLLTFPPITRAAEKVWKEPMLFKTSKIW